MPPEPTTLIAPYRPTTPGHSVPRPPSGRLDPTELPIPLDGSIPVRSWMDAPTAVPDFDPRSSYVELFWLGILGPSATLLLRRLATGLVHNPDGFDLSIIDTARSLGLGRPTGRQSPFVRAVHRCCLFRLARFNGPVLEVRPRVPALHPIQLERLPESLQLAHHALEARIRASDKVGSGRSTGE